ncbi:MAG: MBL fold metallo-hydrolase [Candidatus Jordarchaeales archaeon]
MELENINSVVLSHDHGDHTGGLRILEKLGDVEVFVPLSFPSQFKKRLSSYPNVSLVDVSGEREISRNIFTTGELGHFVKEQSLIVRTNRGLTVVTGCAHPGLENILKAASKLGKVYGVVGGLHGFDKLETLKEVGLVAPCHCTARKREILNLYPKTSLKCSAGCIIEI